MSSSRYEMYHKFDDPAYPFYLRLKTPSHERGTGNSRLHVAIRDNETHATKVLLRKVGKVATTERAQQLASAVLNNQKLPWLYATSCGYHGG